MLWPGSDYECSSSAFTVIDLNDNRAWAAGGVTAEQMNDRILVVAGMPNGTGLVHQTGIPGGSIDVLFNIESWTIGADIHGTDRVEVFRNGSGIIVSSDNRTAETIEIWTDGERAGYWNGDIWNTEWSMSEWQIVLTTRFPTYPHCVWKC